MMTLTQTTKTCLHSECDLTIRDHELACRTHWYQLPTPLRNRIWKHWKSGDTAAHRKAVAEAVATWTPPSAIQLRCQHCRRYTDFTDNDTGQPICLVCATAGMNTQPEPHPCSSCGNESTLLVSLTDRPPHICVDCIIATLHTVESM